MYGVADRRSYGVSLEGRLGQAYNEDAFRYFFEIERKRAARAHRPVLLLLLDLRDQPAADPRIVIQQIVGDNALSSTAISVGQVLWVPRT